MLNKLIQFGEKPGYAAIVSGIVDAIARRDREGAAQAMRDVIMSGRDRVKSAIA